MYITKMHKIMHITLCNLPIDCYVHNCYNVHMNRKPQPRHEPTPTRQTPAPEVTRAEGV